MKFCFKLTIFALFVAAFSLCQANSTRLNAQEEKTESSETKSDENKSEESETQESGEQEKEESSKDDEAGKAETTQDTAVDDSPEGLKLQWTQVNADLDAQQIAYDEADDASRPDIQTKYEELVEKARGIVTKMKEAAIKELPNTENKDELFKRLVGIMIDDASNDRGDEVLRVGQILVDNGIERQYFEKASKVKRLRLADRAYFDELLLIISDKDANLPQVKIETSKGEIVVELFENAAPGVVGNFISLIEKNYYDGLTFHRVLDGFMAQGGDPKGDGTGGPGYKIFSEFDHVGAHKHFPGSLSMANSGKDTAGSQFFICFNRPEHLDGKHTVFGRVIQGMDVLPKLQRIDPNDPNKPDPDVIVKMEVIRKTEGREYKPNIVPGSEKAEEESADDKSEEKSSESEKADGDGK